MGWIMGSAQQRAIAVLVVVVGAALLTPLIARIPVLGHDWQVCFEARDGLLPAAGDCYDQYPPWTRWILRPLTALPWRLGLSFHLGMTFMAVAVGTCQGAERYGEAAVLAVLTPPVLMLMWIGQIDGMAMWGLMFLPLGMLWALTKPNITVWVLFARWQWIAWAAVLGLVSILIWGWWPGQLLAARSECTLHPAAMGWANLGWPVVLAGGLLLPFSGRHPLRLMAAGALLMPFLMPYHFLYLLPALGQVRGWKRWLLWLLVWTTAAVPAVGGITRYVALCFPIAVWVVVSPDPFRGHRILVWKIRALILGAY